MPCQHLSTVMGRPDVQGVVQNRRLKTMRIANTEQDDESDAWASNGEGLRRPAQSGIFDAVREPSSHAVSIKNVADPLCRDLQRLEEGEVRLVVVRQGAEWPAELASILSGGTTTCIVVERPHETLTELAQRVANRMQQMEQSVAQLIWLSVGVTCEHELPCACQLVQQLGAPPLLVVVPSGAKAHYIRALTQKPTGMRRAASDRRIRRFG